LPGNDEKEREDNAKYAISLARKFGATIFCVWEDVGKVNKKMLLIFIASLYDLHLQK
jgi:plastin-1